MQLHITIEYNGDAKTFVKEFEGYEQTDYYSKEKQNEMLRALVLDDFHSTFNIKIVNEDGEEI